MKSRISLDKDILKTKLFKVAKLDKTSPVIAEMPTIVDETKILVAEKYGKNISPILLCISALYKLALSIFDKTKQI